MERIKFRRARKKPRPNANNKPNNKPSWKQEQWTETQMTSTMKEAKQSKKPNINRISKRYNVLRSTLQDFISGHVTHGTNPWPWPYLTAEEEKSLTTHFIDAAKLGFGKTRKKVNRMAAREKGTLHKGWSRRFIEGHSQLSLCQADFTAHVRMGTISQESITRYFDLLESTLKEHQLEDCPRQILYITKMRQECLWIPDHQA